MLTIKRRVPTYVRISSRGYNVIRRQCPVPSWSAAPVGFHPPPYTPDRPGYGETTGRSSGHLYTSI